MGGSLVGAALLLVIGIGFLGSALVGWLHRNDCDTSPGVVSIVVDVIVGAVALADAAISLVDKPAQVLLWTVGSIALAAAVALLVRHLRPPSRSHR